MNRREKLEFDGLKTRKRKGTDKKLKTIHFYETAVMDDFGKVFLETKGGD